MFRAHEPICYCRLRVRQQIVKRFVGSVHLQRTKIIVFWRRLHISQQFVAVCFEGAKKLLPYAYSMYPTLYFTIHQK
jgi:hypothetical protein